MTTQVPMTDDIMDFTRRRDTIKFRVDDDVFEAPPDIAAELALRFVDDAGRLDDDAATHAEQVAVIHNMFRMILTPDSAERFIARLSDSTNPIGVDTFQRVTSWLLEQYGLRPTEPGSDSSSGSDNPDTGTNSRVSAFGTASTYVD